MEKKETDNVEDQMANQNVDHIIAPNIVTRLHGNKELILVNKNDIQQTCLLYNSTYDFQYPKLSATYVSES